MAELASGLQLQAVVVGGSSDELVRGVMDLAGGYGIESVRCEDVYSAVGRMAERAGARGVVIGRLGELGKEDGRFFEIARRNGFACCCLVEKDAGDRPREILAAMQAGAFVVTEAAEIEELLMKLSGGSGAHTPEKQEGPQGAGSRARTMLSEVMEKLLGSGGAGSQGKSGASGFLKDEFRTTKAELDALLGD
jgi:hypothetical protein